MLFVSIVLHVSLPTPNDITKYNFRKNLFDVCITAMVYWACGYAFAYGDSQSGFIGNSYYFLDNTEDYVGWFFQFVFAGTTATIVSGAVAERCRFRAYVIYTALLSGFIYPVASHWIWSPQGIFFGKVYPKVICLNLT